MIDSVMTEIAIMTIHAETGRFTAFRGAPATNVGVVARGGL
jgi:hypothetical protein